MGNPVAGVLELNQISNLAAQLATLNKMLDRLDRLNINSVQTNTVCKNCAGKHTMAECPLGGNSTFE